MNARELLTQIEADGMALDQNILQLLAILKGMQADREELEEAIRRTQVQTAARAGIIVEVAMFLHEREHGHKLGQVLQ